MIRPPGSPAVGLSTAPMRDLLLNLVTKQPHVALATGTAIQPLSGFDSITGLDLEAFSKMSGGLPLSALDSELKSFQLPAELPESRLLATAYP